ncbi:peptidoglycan DD-metalloendopeptidase family protein [Arthrobacter sp.]|uniref:peptidoglycan DD-metalloendopeptidase family protein n=1 Tax=Arthrobacter sp. TaxID=1667 RepID=UPI003A93EAB1
MADRKRQTLSHAVISGALVSLLSLSLVAPMAHADNLDDKKQRVEKQLDSLESDLEFLNADIQKVAEKLKNYQDRLPAAQERLSSARASVQTATDQVNDLTARVEAAQSSKDQISGQMVRDAESMASTRKVIGQIATQAYKRGGVSSNLSLLLNASSDGNLADSMGMADQALRSQNAVLSELNQKNATNANAQARMAAVEAEISDLKDQAEAALAREQAARAEAEASKRHVDELIDGAESASNELNAKRPQIKAQIHKQQAEHDQVIAEIKERQERLVREAAERKRKEEAARKAAEARAAKARAAAERAARANAADAAAKRAAADRAERSAASARSKSDQYTASSTSSWGLSKPVAGGHITSTFGWRPTPAGTIDYGGMGGYIHAGLDWGFGGQCGAPVYAAAGGEVWYASMSATSGNKVQISHGVVNGHALLTGYHHLSSYVVRAGQHVSKGQLIGYVGTTGNSTGCHLHFETVLDGKVVNPMGLL